MAEVQYKMRSHALRVASEIASNRLNSNGKIAISGQASSDLKITIGGSVDRSKQTGSNGTGLKWGKESRSKAAGSSITMQIGKGQ
jgi:hypothetical protein